MQERVEIKGAVLISMCLERENGERNVGDNGECVEKEKAHRKK